MVEEMAIPQADRRRLVKQIKMADNYQKTTHIGHCAEDSICTSHCAMFALSDSNCSAYLSKRNREHTFMCSDRTNIVRTVDEIKKNNRKNL